MMKRLARFRLASGSLLTKLVLSFLSVIILLAVFNVGSYLYLRNKLYDEIVRYNELGIQQSVGNFENHFRLMHSTLMALMQSDKWVANMGVLSRVQENRRYDVIGEVKEELIALYTNPFLHIENFILYFKDADYVLEKDGTSSARQMFSRYYESEAYPPEFWAAQETHDYFLQMLPAARFTESSVNTERSLGLLMPVMVKAAPYEDVYCILMMNVNKLYQAYAYSGNTPFYILDREGSLLYSSHASVEIRQPAATEGKLHERNGDQFYFYAKGEATGFTYVRVTPIASITAEMLRLNILLITLLSAAILISLVTAVLFSVRLTNPIQRIIDMLERKQGAAAATTSIKEFALISDRMSHILKTNERIKLDLDNKNTLVRQYAYTNKVKNIPMNLNLKELDDSVQMNRPYIAVLYQIHFKHPDRDYAQEIQLLWKLVQNLLKDATEEPVTLQMEHNQLMSLLFRPASQRAVMDVLETLKELLKVDDYMYLTIAVSPVYPEDAAFTDAYAALSQLLKERRLNEDTQIIVEPRSAVIRSFHLTVSQSEELHTRLSSGSEPAILEWVDRQLEQLQQQDAAIEDYLAFARGVAEQLQKTLTQLNITDLPVDPEQLRRLRDYYSVEQHRVWYRELILPAAQVIQSKQETKDPVTSFVMAYLDEHLHEDINLDLVADKLNITPGYLSSSFKEKTGTNFSDYLNDLRIRRAKEHLANLELRIQDVAGLVGYHNVNSFIRMFKRYAGVTPGEYRKRIVR